MKSPRILNIAMAAVIALFLFVVGCSASPDISVLVGGASIPAGGVDFGTCSRSEYPYPPYADKTVTVKNLGSAALEMSGTVTISSGGSNAGEFSISDPASFPSSITIPSGGQYEFTLRFEPSWGPTYYDDEERRETVIVASNDPDEGSYSFQVFGVGAC